MHKEGMMKNTLQDLMEAARLVAAEASFKIMDIYVREDVQLSIKADNSPLTQADMAAHHHILQRLQQLTPDIPILSEENADEIAVETRLDWNRYWLIDPLDGTREFIAQNGEFTVNIALIENHQATVGVVAVPAKKISYFAAKGIGAFIAGSDEQAHTIKCRKFGGKGGLPEVVLSRRSGLEHMDDYLQILGNYQSKSIGSSIKMCRIAEGKADLYPRLGNTSEWDTAASQCIIEEAGGAIVDMKKGEPLKYGTKPELLNPQFLAVGEPANEKFKSLVGRVD